MRTARKKGLLFSTVILAATSSLCCIIPILTILGGVTGIASTFSWLQPLRPYFLALTLIALGLAFYQTYKPVKADECGCITERKSPLQSKKILWIITILAITLMTFPYYSEFFYETEATKPHDIGSEVQSSSTFTVLGMTCESCEHHVESVLAQQAGVIKAVTNFEDSTTYVLYDKSQTSLKTLMAEVTLQTGYKTLQ